MGNGQWAICNRQWAIGNRQQAIGQGQYMLLYIYMCICRSVYDISLYISSSWAGSAMARPKWKPDFFHFSFCLYFYMMFVLFIYEVLPTCAALGFKLPQSYWVQCKDDLGLIMESSELRIWGCEKKKRRMHELHNRESDNCCNSYIDETNTQ